MAWQKCGTINCGMHIRAGLVRNGTGCEGQELADGRYCWKCRARWRREDKRLARKEKLKQKKGTP